MIYIKTKDGRIIKNENVQIIRDKLPNILVETRFPLNDDEETDCYGMVKVKTEILFYSTSIEDLCDEFVIVDNADERPFRINCDTFYKEFKVTGYTCLNYAIERFNKLKEFVGSAENHHKEVDYLYEDNPNYEFNGCIKGAIWTDKGLTYVAKMNDKGELELI